MVAIQVTARYAGGGIGLEDVLGLEDSADREKTVAGDVEGTKVGASQQSSTSKRNMSVQLGTERGKADS